MQRAPGYVDRLAHEQVVWMCTLRPDGSPHVTPVWFVYRDGVWWIGSDERSVKVRNVPGRCLPRIPRPPWEVIAAR